MKEAASSCAIQKGCMQLVWYQHFHPVVLWFYFSYTKSLIHLAFILILRVRIGIHLLFRWLPSRDHRFTSVDLKCYLDCILSLPFPYFHSLLLICLSYYQYCTLKYCCLILLISGRSKPLIHFFQYFSVPSH